MVAHRHVFTSPDGSATRELPQDIAGEDLRVVSSFLLKGQANGGVTDITGAISVAELAEFDDIYAEGARWEVFDDDDSTRPFRGRGRLDAPKANPDGTVTLHAEGPCKKYEQDAEARRMWQNRNMGEWTPDDQQPYGYDSDEQIEAQVQGQEIVLGWNRNQAFIRATGKAELDSHADKGDESVEIDINGGGLNDGEWIHIGNETRKVKNTYSPGSTTIPIKTKLDHDHDAGTRVQWRASGDPDNWATGVIAWFPSGVEISRIAAGLDKSRNPDGTSLKIYSGVGPDNVDNLLDTISMDGGGGGTIDINAIPAGHDAVRIRLVRTKADEKTEAFRVRIQSLRINDRAGNDDDYETHRVVKDIAAFSGGGNVDAVADSVKNAMPLDTEGGSTAAILDRMALLDKRYWAVEYDQVDGNEKQWFYRDFGARVWHVTDEDVEPDWTPLPRYNVAVGAFRYAEGGQQHFSRQRAIPDPFPGESRALPVDLAEPLPYKTEGDALLRNIADLAAKERQACRAKLLWVEDPDNPGVRIPAGRIRAGDSLVFVHHLDKELDVYTYEFDDDFLTVDTTPQSPGQTGIPSIDSALEQRALALERGRGNAWASLHMFDLDEPLPPLDLAIIIEEADARGGHRRFDVIADFSPVLEDINGKGTAVQAYDIDFRVTDSDGDKVGPIRHRHLRPKKDNDPVDDDVPTRIVLHDVPKPHKWFWSVRGRTTDIFGKKSDPTDWTEPQKPAAFAPDAPEALVADIDGQRLEADWERPDPEEIDTAGDEVLDQRVDKFRWKLFKNGSYTGKNGVTRATHLSTRTKRPGTASFELRVWSQDQYGNLSATYASVTTSKVNPPSPPSGAAGKPSVVIIADDVAPGQREAVVSFYYTTDGTSGGTDLGSAGQYGDGDVDHFRVEAQTADDAAFTKKVRQLDTHVIDYDGLIQNQTVWKGIKKGRHFRARYRAVDDRQHKGGRGDWS